MMGFYAIRKLIEATKLTNKLTDTPISVRLHRSRGKPVTRLNNHRVDELYDLDRFEQTNLLLKNLCHQFIHSYIFVPVLDESGGLSEIWIASDHQRSKALIAIRVRTIMSVFEKVSNDEVHSMHSTFDDSLGDYRIKNYSASTRRRG
jgi:hypothetical protein